MDTAMHGALALYERISADPSATASEALLALTTEMFAADGAILAIELRWAGQGETRVLIRRNDGERTELAYAHGEERDREYRLARRIGMDIFEGRGTAVAALCMRGENFVRFGGGD